MSYLRAWDKSWRNLVGSKGEYNFSIKSGILKDLEYGLSPCNNSNIKTP